MFSRAARARGLLLTTLTMAVWLGSCSRRTEPAIQRLAILRFENLASDTAVDWMGRALAEVITADLSGSAKIYAIPGSRLHTLDQAMGARPVSAPGISAEAQQALAAGANRVGYGEYTIVGGRLFVRLTVEDPQGRRMVEAPLQATVDGADPIGAGDALARQLSKEARPYGTRSAAALEAYAKATESPDGAALGRLAEQAIAADPNYGAAYALLTELKAKQRDGAGAMATLQAAAARGAAMAGQDRLRLEVLSASLRGDSGAMERALAASVKHAPLDAPAWRALAGASSNRRAYEQAVTAYQRAATIEPEDVNTWNQLGYAAAYAGKLDVALSALRRYEALRPAEANPLDSMGDVNLLAGRWQEAERLYRDAYKKNPGFLNGAALYKAAVARLMTGDVTGANAIVKDPGAAEWLWLTGRRKEAYSRLLGAAAALPNRDTQAGAYAKLTVWSLLLGDREGAARMAQQAAAVATPTTMATAAVARFVSLPSAGGDEWRARADRMFPNAPPNSIRDVALAYALLLDRQFQPAIPLLKQLEARTPSAGERSAAIELAWALVETGNLQEAAPLLKLNPVPGAEGMGPFAGLYFPRIFQLRALLAERDGRADEARDNRKIYAALGGE